MEIQEPDHPWPIGTRCRLDHPSRWSIYRVIASLPMNKDRLNHGQWYYRLAAEEHYDSPLGKGIILDKDGTRCFAGAGQGDKDLIWHPPDAFEIYDGLRELDP